MPRLIPANVAFEKRAALLHADGMGRDMAHDQVVLALAEQAGQILKEAGVFSRIGGAIAKRLAPKAGKLARRGRRAVGKVTRAKAPAGAARGRWTKPAPPKPKPEPKGGWEKPVKPGAKPEGRVLGAAEAKVRRPAVGGAYRAGPAGAPAAAPSKATPAVERAARAPARPGRVPPAQAAAPTPGKVQPAAAAPAAQPAAAGAPPELRQAGGGYVRKGWGPGKWLGAAALGTLGLGAYGAYKAAPHALRMLEQTSATPMAPSMGWSPTPYGYGYSPYGPGSPTMGPGG